MEKSQIGNLLEVAMDTDSVELVKNFIQYQMGRDVGGTTWRSNAFGDNFVKAIDGELKTMARDLATKASERQDLGTFTPAELAEATDAAWIGLVRHFIGQMNRYFYYQKEAQRWKK